MESGIPCAAPTHSVRKHAVPAHAKPAAPWRKKIGHQPDTHRIKIGVRFGASGDTELFEKASNINGFQGGRVANNLYISPFRATVFKTAALFLYLNSSVVIRVRKPLFFPL